MNYFELRASLLQRQIADALDPDPIVDVLRAHSERFDPEHTVGFDGARITCASCGELPVS